MLASLTPTTSPGSPSAARPAFRHAPGVLRALLFTAVLIAINSHLITGGNGSALVFMPAAFMAGDWWTLLTHPFIHVSWYHLALDGITFYLLYFAFQSYRLPRLLTMLALCTLGSALLSLGVDPMIDTLGLCGLSGVSHGLMVVYALEIMRAHSDDRQLRMIGAITLAATVLKCMFELITGDVFFSFLHVGAIGSPVVACHAGGALGGLLFYTLSRNRLTAGMTNAESPNVHSS